MKFGDELDKYIVLKLPLHRYKGTNRTLESDFQIVGSEVREKIRKDEKKCGITRDAFLNAMTAQNIGVGVHYLSIPEHPYYQETFGWRPEDYPNAMRTGRQTISLPLSPKLTEKDVQDVIEAVRKIVVSPLGVIRQ